MALTDSEVKDMFRSIALEWFEARTTDFTEKHRGTVMYDDHARLLFSQHLARAGESNF